MGNTPTYSHEGCRQAPRRKARAPRPASTYYPTKDELEEDVSVDATPEEVRAALVRSVCIEERRVNFARSTRAAATSMMAVLVAIMSHGGGAILIDHLALWDQRETLRSAVNAAALAATQRYAELRRLGRTESEIAGELTPLARGFVESNLQHLTTARRVRAAETLTLTVTPNRESGVVAISAKADLGGFLFSPHFFSVTESEAWISVSSRAAATMAPLAMVLAIDVSTSMTQTLAGDYRGAIWTRRLEIVRQASRNLVDIVRPNPDTPVSVGLVPWGAKVCPGQFCTSFDQEQFAPTTSRASILQALNGLRATEPATASFIGIERATDLLLAIDVERRALVILTDGEDNYCGHASASGEA